MSFDRDFAAWFLPELIAALTRMQLEEGDNATRGRVSAPSASGQTTRDARGATRTPRQSNLLPRPGLTSVTTRVGGSDFILGDTARRMGLVWPSRGTVHVPRVASFADFLIPPSPPVFMGQRAFVSNATAFSGFYPSTSLPLDADGIAPSLPAFPLRLDAAGAWAMRWAAPPAIGAGLGMLPMVERQHYFYDAPGEAWPTYGSFPSDNLVRGSWNDGNDYQWAWSAAAALRRPNLLWPYQAGVKDGAWYQRLPDSVASAAPNAFSYLHGLGPWVFPATETALRVFYLGEVWSWVQERGYPYVTDPDTALPTYPLTSPPDYETWFMQTPFRQTEWVYLDECPPTIFNPTPGEVYEIDPPLSPLPSSIRASALPYTVAVAGGANHVPQDWGALYGSELGLITWQPPVQREIGSVLDSLDAVDPVEAIVPTTRVYENESTEPGQGAIRLDRWVLAPSVGPDDDGVIYSTPERRVVDRYSLDWEERAERLGAGEYPHNDWTCAPVGNGWEYEGPLNGHVGGHIAHALMIRMLDWGVCSQDYRVIIRRYAWSGFEFRHNSCQIVLQRRNNGGDFVVECGLSNWGVSSQTFGGNNQIGLPHRMRASEVPAEGSGWWTRYTAAQAYSARAQLNTNWTPYFDAWAAGLERCPITVMALQPSQFPWYTHDPSVPWKGRAVDPYAGGTSGMYPNAPTRVAFDFNRAGVWYDVGIIEDVGVREAYTTDDEYEESSEDASCEIQVITDNAGVPFYEPGPNVSWGTPLFSTLTYPNTGQIIQRFIAGANLYEGAFGTLPAPFAAASRVETFCGLAFDAGDAFAVDVVTHPDGGVLAVAVALDWTYRATRGVADGPVWTWTQVATGSVTDLLNTEDAAAFLTTSPPVQEYAFAQEGWPLPLGRLRSNRQTLAFRAATPRTRATGSTGPIVMRLAGSM